MSFIKTIFFDLGDTLVTKSQTWVPGAQQLLIQLHSTRLRLGIISNTGTLKYADLPALLPTDFDLNLFERNLVILSAEFGNIEKPDVRIFKEGINRAALGASQCLFCTETLLDTMVAQKLDMRAVRVQIEKASDGRVIKSDVGSLINNLQQAGLLG